MTIKEIWRDFLKIFEEQGINKKDLGFRDGICKEEISKAEKLFSIKFPDDYREFLMICNGQEYGRNYLHWLPERMQLLGIDEIIEEWNDQIKVMEEAPDALEFYDEYQYDNKIRAIVFHKKWIPIAGAEGVCWIFLDYVPGPKGYKSQLIYNINECDFIVLANSFSALIQHYIELFKKGHLKMVKENTKDHQGYLLKPKNGNYLNAETFLELVKNK